MARRGGNANGRPIGIKDVAAAAGVSITTVSHALNGKGRLPAATRAHVRNVAEELGYHANATAKHLAVGRTGLVALVMSDAITESYAIADLAFYARLTVAASDACLQNGYGLVLAGNASSGAWRRTRPDAVFGIDPVEGDEIWGELDDREIPYVTVGRVLDHEHGAWVDNDLRSGTRTVLDRLRDLGARHIALISTGLENSVEKDMKDTYRGWCDEEGMRPVIAVGGADLTETSGFDAMQALLAGRPRPDAVFATTDRLALGALLAARATGLDVPREVMIVACSDSEAARWTRPALSALDLAPATVAREAITMLVSIVEGTEEKPGPRYVKTSLIERESTRRGGAWRL